MCFECSQPPSGGFPYGKLTLNRFTSFFIIAMKNELLLTSDLELFASRFLGLKDSDFDSFYEQYYNLNVDDELEGLVEPKELYTPPSHR